MNSDISKNFKNFNETRKIKKITKKLQQIQKIGKSRYDTLKKLKIFMDIFKVSINKKM